MGEILPKHYIIGIIIFTFVTVGGISILSELRQSNPAPFNTEQFLLFNNTFNTYDDITTEVEGIRSNIESTDSQFGLFGFLDNLISGAWNSIKLLFQSFGFMDDVLTGVSGFFGVPVWATSLISLIITVIIAFAIYAAIFQREI